MIRRVPAGLAAALAALMCLPPEAAGQATAMRIGEIQVKLWRRDQGVFSDNLVGRTDIELLNTEFSSPPWGPASQFIVAVRIDGPVDSPQRGTVRIRAESRMGIIGSSSVVLPRLERGGQAWVAAIINRTGCDSVLITVELVGSSRRLLQRSEARLPFHCGE